MKEVSSYIVKFEEKKLFLRNYRAHLIESSSDVPRYRIVSSVCDIEVSKSVYDFLVFASEKIGCQQKSVFDEYKSVSGLSDKKILFAWEILEEKGIIVNSPTGDEEKNKKEYRNRNAGLWFRVPLFKAEGMVWGKIGEILTNKWIVGTILFLVAFSEIVLLLVIFKNIIVISYKSVFDYLILFFLSFFVTFCHEVGHMTTAKYYGVKDVEIGIGVYYFFCVAYSDVHGIWELPRKQRIVVSVAGLYVQLIFIPLLIILLIVSRNSIILDCIVLLHISLLIIINPFLKMDGYWLLSHYLGVTSLHLRLKEYLLSVLLKNRKNPFASYPKRVKEIICSYVVAFLIATCFLFVFIGYYFLKSFFFNPEKFLIKHWYNLWTRIPFSKEWVESFCLLFRNVLFVISVGVISVKGLILIAREIWNRLFKVDGYEKKRG